MDSNANNAIRIGDLHRADIRDVVFNNLADLGSRGVVAGFDAASISRVMDDRTLTSTMIDGLLGLELNLKALDRLADPSARAVAAP